MKNALRRMILGLVLVSVLGGSAWAQGRIGTVDLRKVFDGYWKTKQADAALKERAADMEKEFKAMVSDYETSKKDYQKLLDDANNQALSQDERDKRKKAAEDKLKQLKENEDTINAYKRTATTTIDEQRKRMRDSIVEEIRTVLNAKAKSASYALVLDTAAESANFTPVVLYSSKENDLTDEVLSQLNAAAPADAVKSDTKPADKKDDKKDDKKK